MAVRRATVDDLPELMRMGIAFAKFARLPMNPESIADTLVELMYSESALLVIGDGAMAAAIAYPLFTDRAVTMVDELFWWVDEEKRSSGIGSQLVNAIESWSKSIGAQKSLLTSSWFSPPHVAEFYVKNGYKPLETKFMRDMSCQ